MKETYKKPVVTNNEHTNGIIPAVGLGFALALAAKGNTTIDSNHTQTLTRRINSK